MLWSTPLFAGATPAGAFIDFQICDDHYQVMAYSNRAVPLTSAKTDAPTVASAESCSSSQPRAPVSAEQHAPSCGTAVGTSRERRRPNAAKFATAFVNADLEAAALKRREEDEDSRRDSWIFAANPPASTTFPNSSADDHQNSDPARGNVRYRSALASAAAAPRAFGAAAAASSLTFDERAETHASLSAAPEHQQQLQCMWATFEATPVSAAMTSAAVRSLTASLSSVGGARPTAPPPSAVLISLQLLYLPERRETIVRSLELRLSLKWIDKMYGTAHAAHAARVEASAGARGF